MKNVIVKVTKYIPKCWERSLKKKPNFKLIRLNKYSAFDQHFVYIWYKPYEAISCSPLRPSSRYRCNLIIWEMKFFNFTIVSILSNKHLFCGIKSFSLMHWSVQFIIKVLSVSEHNSQFRSFTVSYCALIWLLSNIVSS